MQKIEYLENKVNKILNELSFLSESFSLLNTESFLPIGSIIQSTIEQTDAKLHLADGSTLQVGGIYDDFCQYAITNASKFPHYEDDENKTALQKYQDDIDTYGQCGKYVITSTYVKLPKITEFVASANDNKELGSAELDEFKQHTHSLDDAFSDGGTQNQRFSFQSISSNKTGWGINTLVSGGSETKPKNIRYYFYIVIGTITKNEIGINIDNVINELQSKANTNGSNITNIEDWNKKLNNVVTLYQSSLQQAVSSITIDGFTIADGESLGYEISFLNSGEADILLKVEGSNGNSRNFNTVGIASTGGNSPVYDGHYEQSSWVVGYLKGGRIMSEGKIIVVDGDVTMVCNSHCSGYSSSQATTRLLGGSCQLGGSSSINKVIFSLTNGSFPTGTHIILYKIGKVN